jgi:hypothetical protein
MATLSATGATVLPDGRIIEVTFAGTTPTNVAVMDWIPGALAGVSLTASVALGTLEHVGNTLLSSGGTLTCTARYLITDSSKVVIYGQSAFTLSAGGGLLQDVFGNTTASLSGLSVTNHSLVQADGFTSQSLPRGTGGIALYVSSSHGNDTTGDGSLGNPFATIGKAHDTLFLGGHDVDGSAVRLLRGDTFANGLQFKCQGQNRTHPFVLESYWNGSYGTDPGTRPLINYDVTAHGGGEAFKCTGGGGTPLSVSNVLIRQLEVVATNTTGAISGVTGFSLLRGGSDWTIDDCIIRNFGDNITLIGFNGPWSNFTLLRTVLADSFSDSGTTGDRPQGLFVDGCTAGLLISQSPLIDNGRTTSDHTGSNIFSHNCYLHEDLLNDSAYHNGPAVVWGNIFRGGGSHGIQMRSGGVLAYCHLPRNAIACSLDGLPGGWLFKNVVELGRDIDGNVRAWGLDLGSNYSPSLSQCAEWNIHANAVGGASGDGPRALQLTGIGPTANITSSILRHNTDYLHGFTELETGANHSNAGTTSTNIRNVRENGPVYLYVNYSAAAPGTEYTGDDNALHTSKASGQQTIVTDNNATLAAWKSATNNSESHSIVGAVTFVNAAASAGDFYASVGGTNSESAYVTAIKTRPLGTWRNVDNLQTLYAYYASQFKATNLPSLGSGTYDYIGVADYRAGGGGGGTVFRRGSSPRSGSRAAVRARGML